MPMKILCSPLSSLHFTTNHDLLQTTAAIFVTPSVQLLNDWQAGLIGTVHVGKQCK
jgi:hypothetical protein